jgi:hypothetical protein
MSVFRFPGKPFPTDLGLAALRLAACSTLAEAERKQALEDRGAVYAGPVGYLQNVPLLRGVEVFLQLELLGRLLARHQSPQEHRLNLLGSAALFAAVAAAAELAEERPEEALAHLQASPQPVTVAIGGQAGVEWWPAFLAWWGLPGQEFLRWGPRADLSVHDVGPRPLPGWLMGEDVRALFAALVSRATVRTLNQWLGGLVTAEEHERVLALLRRDRQRPWR